MNFNFEKIKRSKFLNYTLISGAAFFLFKKIPFVIANKEHSSNSKIIIKSNPLSVRRENSGDKNV